MVGSFFWSLEFAFIKNNDKNERIFIFPFTMERKCDIIKENVTEEKDEADTRGGFAFGQRDENVASR